MCSFPFKMIPVAQIVFLLDSNVLVKAFDLKGHFLAFNSSDTGWDLTSSVGTDGISLVAGDQDKGCEMGVPIESFGATGAPSTPLPQFVTLEGVA